MQMSAIPFGTTDWFTITSTEHPGKHGKAFWRACQIGVIRVRIVGYSPNSLAGHWCSKGRILPCIEGGLYTKLANGRSFALKSGMSYQVTDDAEPHRSSARAGPGCSSSIDVRSG